MALFKISKGLKANLPKTYNEGYCYFTTDDGKFYVDTSGSGTSSGNRVCLNSYKSDFSNCSYYGTCNTATGTAAKTVTLSSGTDFVLQTGAIVTIKFTNANTATNATLNINSTGAKAIYDQGSAISNRAIKAKETYQFIYNGSQWEVVGCIIDVTAGSETVPVYTTNGVPMACTSLSLDTSGNAATATKLATARTISLTGSVTGSGSFDGSGNLSITTTTNHNHDSLYPKKDGTGATGDWAINVTGSSKSLSYNNQLTTNDAIDGFLEANKFKTAIWNIDTNMPATNGIILSGAWTNTSFGFQLAVDDDPTYIMSFRQKGTNGWNAWKRIPMGDGTGASGTWPISITGNAAYSAGASKLYSTDSSYSYTSGNPYYGYLTYNSPYWDFKVSPASPDDIRVSAAYTDAEGYSITGYLKNYEQMADLSSSKYNVNTWYPVLIYVPKGGMHKITCACQLDTNVPSWSTHSSGFTRVVEMLVTGSGWGTTDAGSICLYNYSAFEDTNSVGYSQFNNSSSACFWCRGGGKYRIITDFKESVRIYTSSTTVSSQTVAPTTTYPGMSFVKSTITANLVGDSVKGAVWNDYAEYRESDCKEFGRVLIEKGDDTLIISTERLQPFAGISSDTWGFSQGETEKAKTPIAVAGRVLAFTYQDRNNYKPGDCVCTAPNGTVDIMTREEVINWPDRIIGTVSCVPDYEEWGGGSDRKSVKINNRIWIKIK